MTDTHGTFAIIEVHGKSPDNAIAVGSMSAVMERIVDTHARDDAIEKASRAVVDAVEAEQRKEAALACTVRAIADSAAHVASRLDAYVARRAERARRQAADEAAAEAKRIEDELAALPDPDDPDGQLPDPPLPTAADVELHPEDPTLSDPLATDPPEDRPKGKVIPQPTALFGN